MSSSHRKHHQWCQTWNRVFSPQRNVQFGFLCSGRNREVCFKYLLWWLDVMDPPAGKGEPAQDLSRSLCAPGNQMVHALSLNSWKAFVPLGGASGLEVILGSQESPRPDPYSPWQGYGQTESTALHWMVLTSKWLRLTWEITPEKYLKFPLWKCTDSLHRLKIAHPSSRVNRPMVWKSHGKFLIASRTEHRVPREATGSCTKLSLR